MRLARNFALFAAAMWLAACRPSASIGSAGAPDPTPGPGSLVTSLTVQATRDSVRFTLAVTNAAAGAATLHFTSGQRYDFSVRDRDRVLWTWSADRSFMQAVGSETLAPGETRSYSESWRPAPDAAARTLTGVGVLTTAGGGIERTAQFTLP